MWHPAFVDLEIERDLQIDASLEEGEEKKPPAKAFDMPKRGDSSTPTGGARLTLLKTFLPIAVKFNV